MGLDARVKSECSSPAAVRACDDPAEVPVRVFEGQAAAAVVSVDRASVRCTSGRSGGRSARRGRGRGCRPSTVEAVFAHTLGLLATLTTTADILVVWVESGPDVA
jgi:hypothetical protein